MRHFALGNPPLHQVSFMTLVAGQSFIFSTSKENVSLKQEIGKVIFKVGMLHTFDLKGSKNFQRTLIKKASFVLLHPLYS